MNNHIHVPCNSAPVYRSAAYWNQFASIEEEFPYEFNASSADVTRGTVQLLHAPECNNLQAEVLANPYNGFIFVQWSDSNTDAHRYLVVVQDTAIQAVFAEKVTVTVSVNDSTMGNVTGGGDYAKGSTVTLTATSNSGYRFVRWNDNNTDNPRTITVNSDISFTAYFESDGTQGIGEVGENDIRISVFNGRIYVEGITNKEVRVYDITGRLVQNRSLPSGVYIVKVGNLPARKVVVIR